MEYNYIKTYRTFRNNSLFVNKIDYVLVNEFKTSKMSYDVFNLKLKGIFKLTNQTIKTKRRNIKNINENTSETVIEKQKQSKSKSWCIAVNKEVLIK